MKKYQTLKFVAISLFILLQKMVAAQQLDQFKIADKSDQFSSVPVSNDVQFNGYTNYWQDNYNTWHRYGNLFKMATPDLEKSILQSKIDVAEDMGIPGLIMQEGFIHSLLSGTYKELDNPDAKSIEAAASKENVLAFVSPNSQTGKMLHDKFSFENKWPELLKSHQYGSPYLKRIDAFYLENGDRKIFIVSTEDTEVKEKFRQLLQRTAEVLKQYDLHKGWFGAQSLLKSVTCTDGHPLEIIGKGMNEGNTWFVFNGYMDFLAQDELINWMKEVNLPVVADVGFSPIFGCKDYDGLQVQSMFTRESWIDYAKEKQGYIFRNVWDTAADPLHYDGYFAIEGNKQQIDSEDVPFVLSTGRLDEHALSSMVLFLEKGQAISKESMWEAIMDRREVGVLSMGKMLGPAEFRNVLQLLLLDKDYLEEYFGDLINLETRVEGYDLHVTMTNAHSKAITGELEIALPNGLKLKERLPASVSLPAGSTKTLRIPLSLTKDAMEKTNPIAVHYSWNGKKKSTLNMLDMPQAISVHRLLYAHAPEVSYPVTIHNFTNKSSFPVKLEVIDINDGNKVVFKTSQNCEAATASFKDMLFKLEVAPGSYNVTVTALGVEYVSQLGVGKAEGKPYVYAQDLNSDGVDEYRMENDSVQVTLLATGARVIEYRIKSRDDNVLFKLWPKKAIDDKRPFRYRGYYPYGGFEDFLGQGSMETHQVYDAEIVKKEGDYVRVRMWTDYFGNRLEKTFTLYGNSPLLEVRFALTFKNPEANVLGPQPILELGQRHWTEDVFTIPEMDGLHEYRMKPERYYGRVFFMKEGWNAGYDSKEDITFVGAFPVAQPLFLHMWMNHPRNGDAHHYYTEFQPWTPIYQKSTMYFSYYIWGAGGPWENGVSELRKMNLITTQ